MSWLLAPLMVAGFLRRDMPAGVMRLSEVAFVKADTSGGAPGRLLDEGKFDLFYRRTAAPLWGYLYKLTHDRATADDLLQKSFLRLLRANPMVSGEEHLRRYLYRIASNLALDHFRETKRREAELTGQETASPDHGDLRRDLMRIFAELKPRERILLWLAHVEEASHQEIAEALGLRTRSVRVLLFRARKRLGESLARHGVGPEVLR